MNDYVEVTIAMKCLASGDDKPTFETAADIISALLVDIGYESFTTDAGIALTAYIREADYNEDALNDVLENVPFTNFRFSTEIKVVKGEDWNIEWEKNYFKPIVVGERCVIHSSFHVGYPQCEYEIVIDPKMAFGTGHHATTSQIIEQLVELPLRGKRVIDMGTGTGILAILAAMRGASNVTAIEIDPVAVANARENVELNGHPEINVLQGDASALEGCRADLFIANINRNIITSDLSAYAATLNKGGVMLLSGFYEKDIPVVMEYATPLGLEEVNHSVKGDGWTCLVLKRA